MVDSISRADAIEIIYKKYPYNAEQNKCDEMVDALKALPSTDRPTGKWIIHADDLFPEESTQECSVCHEKQFVYMGNDDDYCPNCGARMLREDGEI